MKNIRSAIPRIIGVSIIIVAIIFALKGCVIESWVQPPENSTYAIYGDDGRIMKLIFREKPKAILYYKGDVDFEEAVQVDLRGTYGTNYWGPVWRLTSPENRFGIRIYPKDIRPVSAEMTIEKRYLKGNGDSTFAKTGKTTYPVLLIRDGAINFSDMWLEQEEPNIDFINKIFNKLEHGK